MEFLPPDPYEALGVQTDATLDEITKAYRKLLVECLTRQSKEQSRGWPILTSPESQRRPSRKASQGSIGSQGSRGSQVSDESMDAGQSTFQAIDELTNEHLAGPTFATSRLGFRRPKGTPAKEAYREAITDFLGKVHSYYRDLDNIATGIETTQRDHDLVVLYDDMKLAFREIVSKVREAAARVPDDLYVQSHQQLLGFGERLDPYMGRSDSDVDLNRCRKVDVFAAKRPKPWAFIGMRKNRTAKKSIINS